MSTMSFASWLRSAGRLSLWSALGTALSPIITVGISIGAATAPVRLAPLAQLDEDGVDALRIPVGVAKNRLRNIPGGSAGMYLDLPGHLILEAHAETLHASARHITQSAVWSDHRAYFETDDYLGAVVKVEMNVGRAKSNDGRISTPFHRRQPKASVVRVREAGDALKWDRTEGSRSLGYRCRPAAFTCETSISA